jgi:hypothetical protein
MDSDVMMDSPGAVPVEATETTPALAAAQKATSPARPNRNMPIDVSLTVDRHDMMDDRQS